MPTRRCGAGWTGADSGERLAADGDEVWGIDKFANVYRRSGERWRLLPGSLVQLDVADR